jgi:hypothetical protein
VHDDITHIAHVTPGNFQIFSYYVLWHADCGLTDDGEVSNHSISCLAILRKKF